MSQMQMIPITIWPNAHPIEQSMGVMALITVLVTSAIERNEAL